MGCYDLEHEFRSQPSPPMQTPLLDGCNNHGTSTVCFLIVYSFKFGWHVDDHNFLLILLELCRIEPYFAIFSGVHSFLFELLLYELLTVGPMI